MTKIISTTQAQKKICEIASNIDSQTYIVTNKGEGRMVIIPYFDGCMDWIEDYLEDYEMMMNKDTLKKRWKESSESGSSGFII